MIRYLLATVVCSLATLPWMEAHAVDDPEGKIFSSPAIAFQPPRSWRRNENVALPIIPVAIWDGSQWTHEPLKLRKPNYEGSEILPFRLTPKVRFLDDLLGQTFFRASDASVAFHAESVGSFGIIDSRYPALKGTLAQEEDDSLPDGPILMVNLPPDEINVEVLSLETNEPIELLMSGAIAPLVTELIDSTTSIELFSETLKDLSPEKAATEVMLKTLSFMSESYSESLDERRDRLQAYLKESGIEPAKADELFMSFASGGFSAGNKAPEELKRFFDVLVEFFDDEIRREQMGKQVPNPQLHGPVKVKTAKRFNFVGGERFLWIHAMQDYPKEQTPVLVQRTSVSDKRHNKLGFS